MPIDLAQQKAISAGERDFRYYHVQRFILHPGQWNGFPSSHPPLRWRRLKFTKTNLGRIPKSQRGVYSFVAKPSIASHPATAYLLYIGKVQGQTIAERYQQYLNEPRSKKRREHIVQMMEKWPNDLYFYYAEVPHAHTISKLEDDLIAAFLPPHNRAFPATIRKFIARTFA